MVRNSVSNLLGANRHKVAATTAKVLSFSLTLLAAAASPQCSQASAQKVDRLLALGIEQQSKGEQVKAISYFEKACQAAPDDWRVALAQSQSLLIMDRSVESIALLQKISAKPSHSFERDYKLGQAFLFLKRPDLSEPMSAAALELAKTPEEKSKSLLQLFIGKIRNNDVHAAQEILKRVLKECHSSDEEVYISAAKIASVLNPSEAAEILEIAEANLKNSGSAGTFFQLGQMFDNKARFVAYDSTKYGAWLKNSGNAYRQALQLNPNPPVFHLALAAVAARTGNTDQMIEELSQAHTLDVQDQLPGYLLSKLKPMQTASTELTNNPTPTDVHLTQATLTVNGLTCNCKRPMIINSFKHIRGLILTTISPRFPYVATILVDESIIPLTDVLSQIEHKPLPELSYKLISKKQIKGCAEPLQIDLDGRNLGSPIFQDTWPEITSLAHQKSE
ncbi:MAG: hypothetical protein U0103_27880 [Candidatus Obscuribacterales bacterium]